MEMQTSEESLVSDRQSVQRGSVTLLVSLLGSGLLGLSNACHQAGVLPFILLGIFAAFTSHWTGVRLVRTSEFVHQSSNVEQLLSHETNEELASEIQSHSTQRKTVTLASLTAHVLGPSYERMVKAIIILQMLGSCVAYILVVGDVYYPLLERYASNTFDSNDEDKTLYQSLVKIFLFVGLVFPLTMSVKDIGALKRTFIVSASAVSLLSLTVFVNACYVLADPSTRRTKLRVHDTEIDWLPKSGFHFVRSVPLICFAFFMHFIVLAVLSDVSSFGSLLRVDLYAASSKRAFMIALPVSLSIGTFGYLTFLGATKGDLLNNFPVSGTYLSNTMNLVKALYAVGLMLAFPIVIWEVRANFMQILYGDEIEPGGKRFWGVSILVFGIAITLGCAVSGLEIVFGLIGATGTPVLAYILPSTLYLACGAAKEAGEENKAKAVIGCGATMIFVGLFVWIYDRIHPNDSM